MPALKDLTGQTFGRLTVTNRAPNKNRRTMWHCKCQCGNERIMDVRQHYVDKVRRVQSINNKLCQIEHILGCNIDEGPIGSLMDMVFESLAPAEASDETYDRLGELLYGDPVDDEDIEAFFDEHFGYPF